MIKNIFLISPLLLTIGCSTDFDSSNCEFLGTCRDGDAFQCKDLYYAVSKGSTESGTEVYVNHVTETEAALEDYCCPDRFCEVESTGSTGNQGILNKVTMNRETMNKAFRSGDGTL